MKEKTIPAHLLWFLGECQGRFYDMPRMYPLRTQFLFRTHKRKIPHVEEFFRRLFFFWVMDLRVFPVHFSLSQALNKEGLWFLFPRNVLNLNLVIATISTWIEKQHLTTTTHLFCLFACLVSFMDTCPDSDQCNVLV